MDQQRPTDLQLRALTSWHLAILRFAVTREHADGLNVLAAANEIDQFGTPGKDHGEFDFFRRTSKELCEAILYPDQASRETALRRYLARVDDLKLKRALTIVMDLEQPEQAPKRPKPYSALWRRQLSR